MSGKHAAPRPEREHAPEPVERTRPRHSGAHAAAPSAPPPAASAPTPAAPRLYADTPTERPAVRPDEPAQPAPSTSYPGNLSGARDEPATGHLRPFEDSRGASPAGRLSGHLPRRFEPGSPTTTHDDLGAASVAAQPSAPPVGQPDLGTSHPSRPADHLATSTPHRHSRTHHDGPETDAPEPRRGSLLLHALGITLALIAWGLLVISAIDFGSEARAGETVSWFFLALAAIGAASCLFLCLILAGRLMRIRRGEPAAGPPRS